MRVRHLVAVYKKQQSDTGWRTQDMQPRYAPCYEKTRPVRNGWKWRSATGIDANNREYVVFANCAPKYDKWQAVLVLKSSSGGASVVARYEYHGDHPGIHAHSSCETSGIVLGSAGLDNLNRFPNVKSKHRRIEALTEAVFWEKAKNFFRLHEAKGPLI